MWQEPELDKAYVDVVKDFIVLYEIRDSITFSQIIHGGRYGPTQEQSDASRRLWEYYDGILVKGMHETLGKSLLWGQPNPDKVALTFGLWEQAEARHKTDKVVR